MRRLSALAAALIIAMWLLLLIFGYAAGQWTTRSYEPDPARVAALVALVEDTPADHRAALFKALETPIFRIALLPPGMPGPVHADEALMRRYSAALSGHSYSAAHRIAPSGEADPFHFNWQGRRVITLQIGLGSGERLVIASTSPAILTGFGIPVGVIAGTVGTVLSLVALWTLWREVAPLTALARAAERMDLSGRQVPLPDTRGQSYEITALAAALARLQDRLAGILQARMALVGGISHDVRTFATRLRLRVEAIPDGAQRDRAIHDLEDMTRLLDDALLAVRNSTGSGGAELIDLPALLRHEVQELNAQDMPVTLALAPGTERAEVLGDPLSLRRVALNLIQNAIRYGHSAKVTLSSDTRTACIRVFDNGTGIPPDLRQELQEPFTRGEASRNRATGGAGLGLAIARTLVETQGGRLSLDPQENGGATVAVFLPLFTPEPAQP